MDLISTKHGKIELPAFMPDATYGSIRSISFQDAKNAGINEIVTTSLHLEQKAGSQYIESLGGIHNFFNWKRPILTDSGGWQVFSLINSGRGDLNNKITEVGCSFIDQENGKHSLLTPESSQVIQHNLDSDIRTVLDDPILGNASLAERKESVRINTIWAKRAKDKFLELNNLTDADFNQPHPSPLLEGEGKHALNGEEKNLRPLLGAVIQGGDDYKLRKQSADELIEIGFDLYNFGGVPMLSEVSWKNEYPVGFYKDMLAYVSELIPNDKIKYAMGVGQPEDIAYCVDKGWNLFDTVLPTRNARHGYLYVSEGQGDDTKSYKELSYDILHLRTERYLNDQKPIDENCKCEACKTVSRAYLRHLIRINEPAGFRMATIHNLTFYSNWMDKLRRKI